MVRRLPREVPLAALVLLWGACGGDSVRAGSPAADAGSAIVADAAPVLPADASCPAEERKTFYADTDGDGFGNPDFIAVDCEAPAGFVAVADDCNDEDPWMFPGGVEVCDGVDNDCDAATTEVCAGGCSPQLRDETGVRYLYCTTQRNHATAVQTCAAEGMHLARIEDDAEQVFLLARRTALWGTSFVAWLGGTDAVDGTWVWDDGTQFWLGNANGTVVDDRYAHWRSGQPGGGSDESCLLMDNEGNTGQWDDRGCGEDRRYICERPLAPAP